MHSVTSQYGRKKYEKKHDRRNHCQSRWSLRQRATTTMAFNDDDDIIFTTRADRPTVTLNSEFSSTRREKYTISIISVVNAHFLCFLNPLDKLKSSKIIFVQVIYALVCLYANVYLNNEKRECLKVQFIQKIYIDNNFYNVDEYMYIKYLC